ncbi:hypothetical protein UREOM_6040 [Ureaplasma sp. OM1]|uniref:Permease n=2 Tax=Ureaplasma ceti TaxID=3119530 RepID=A0ABP9U6C7_9BACT
MKFENNTTRYFFIVYTLYWIPVMLIRSYRGTLQLSIGDTDLLWIVVAGYGFSSVVVRLLANVISYVFKYRKAFLFFSIIVQICLLAPILCEVTTTASILQALAIGIGASCIGSYELLFKEQYSKDRSFLTISLLTIPPLVANFISAPLMSVVRSAATVVSEGNKINTHTLLVLWALALAIICLVFLMLIFLREDKRITTTLVNRKYYTHLKPFYIRHSKEAFLFFLLAVAGMLIVFVKFTNSGAVAMLHIQALAHYTGIESWAYEGWMPAIFSLFQLIAGVLVIQVLIRRWNLIGIFFLASVIWMGYEVAAAFIRNPIGYLFIQILNGFAYGLLFNLVLALVLKLASRKAVMNTMGIYQTFLAVGISLACWFAPWVKGQIMNHDMSFNSYMGAYMIENWIMLGCIGAAMIIFFIVGYEFNKLHKPEVVKPYIDRTQALNESVVLSKAIEK